MKILIVDDNERLTSIMKEILEDDRVCKVETAENGEKGYQAFLQFMPDVILTDIEMPGKNGLEMVKKIRLLDPLVKVVYMSSDMDSYRAYLSKEKTEYSVDLINKPFSFSRVIGMFKEYENEISKN
jgi:YesN/AraC family two-component response regulator